MPLRRLGASALLLSLLGGSCALDQKLNRIPSPPGVELSATRAIYRQGSGPAKLDGRAWDRHDSPAELQLRWTVDGAALGDPFQDEDGDGIVTMALDIDAMELGLHLATLRAVDTDGDLAEAEVIFEVQGPLGSPEVEILAPADGSSFELGAQVVFEGLASDLTTPLSELRYGWESDVQGPLAGAVSADGRSLLVTSGLSVGSHRISLIVVDLDGDVGLDSVAIQIVTPGEDTGDLPVDTGDEPIEDPPDDPVDAEPGDLVLSELMVNPEVVYDTAGEWFELYNTSGSFISIQGYTLRDDDYDTWVIDVPMVVPPHSYFVVCANTDPTYNGGVTTCDAGFLRPSLPPPGLAMGNNGDEVILLRPDGAEIDRLVYDAAWVSNGEAVGVDPSHLSATGNDDLRYWCPQRTVTMSGGEPGTPGLVNDSCP